MPLAKDVSPPTRGAWIETARFAQVRGIGLSPPTRGAWIETTTWVKHRSLFVQVAPHAGGVDSNYTTTN